jgi:hypothetical protein
VKALIALLVAALAALVGVAVTQALRSIDRMFR